MDTLTKGPIQIRWATKQNVATELGNHRLPQQLKTLGFTGHGLSLQQSAPYNVGESQQQPRSIVRITNSHLTNGCPRHKNQGYVYKSHLSWSWMT